MVTQRTAWDCGSVLAPPDIELVGRVRDGDSGAFELLYRRHRDAAMRQARCWARSEAAAEDLCAEGFTRVLFAIRHGYGPRLAFRPYLLTAMRRVAWAWAVDDQVNSVLPALDLAERLAAEPDRVPGATRYECSLMAEVFATLPDRWRTVLWQTEVEKTVLRILAARWGISSAAMAALAYRAREGLRQAYLRACAGDDDH